MKVCKLTCFLQIGGWKIQEDQHNWQQGFLLNLQPTLHLSSHPQLGLIAINKRKILAWIKTSQWPLVCSQQSSLWPVLWRPAGLFQPWRPMCPPSQLGPAVVFSGSSSRGELHLPRPSSSSTPWSPVSTVWSWTRRSGRCQRGDCHQRSDWNLS